MFASHIDATVSMGDAVLSVTEGSAGISVCVVADIAGNIELPLIAIIDIYDGEASEHFVASYLVSCKEFVHCYARTSTKYAYIIN